MKIFINYSDNKYRKQQKFALKMAKYLGGFDKEIAFNPSNIDAKFFQKYRNILEQKKGGGYWLWKPYFILKTLNDLNEGDYLFYSDAGGFFLKSVDILIDELKKSKQDIMGFELPLIESQWTKRELFLNMNCDENYYYESNQILASFMLIKKSEVSVAFVNEYLEYSKNEINITDRLNIKQGDDFIEHRHDQSIFSLLYKKHKYIAFKDPSQLGKHPRSYSASRAAYGFEIGKVYVLDNKRKFRINKYNETYSSVLFLNKRNPRPIFSFLKYKLKEVLYWFKLYNGMVR